MYNIISFCFVYAVLGDATDYLDYYLDKTNSTYPFTHDKEDTFERWITRLFWPCVLFYLGYLWFNKNFQFRPLSMSTLIYKQIDKLIDKRKNKHIVNPNIITKFKVK